MEKRIVLHKGKEKFIQTNRHPWIFSGAVASISDAVQPGDVAWVYSQDGRFLAVAYVHPGNSLMGRILSFEQKPIKEIIDTSIARALAYRKRVISFTETNSFRLVNAEEDALSGLIVDVYKDVAVMQISTLGMEKLKPILIDSIVRHVPLRSLYEKSTSSSRLQEGLSSWEGLLYGELVEEVIAKENNLQWTISITEGQKTGFFLDQREMRRKIAEISKGSRVLNCFSYSGGFSLFALQGGALHVTSVDICSKACQLAHTNTAINAFPLENHRIVQEDVLAFVEKEDLSVYDIIIVDPPAFAKKRQDIEAALQAYRKLNAKILRSCKSGAFVLTCSCSYFIDEPSFRQMLFQAASFAGKEVKIVHSHIRAMDHFVSLYHPEGEYLKSFLLWVE